MSQNQNTYYPWLVRLRISKISDVAFDPLLTFDPDWYYADYRLVQQESTLNEGEWSAIT